MPISEPVVLDTRNYTIRHIGPKATIFPTTPGQTYTVLNNSTMVARPLPTTNLPYSPDFASWQWNGRLYDAGDATITWPNKEASDGQPWRNRFDPTGKLQWLEAWVDGYLEAVVCITKPVIDMTTVTVTGYDGIQMAKSAYVRDWTVTRAPRDVFERGTMLWVPCVTDNFPAGSLNPQWSLYGTGSGGTRTIGSSGGLKMTPVTGSGNAVGIQQTTTLAAASGTWTTTCSFQSASLGASSFVALVIIESSSDTYQAFFYNNMAVFTYSGAFNAQAIKYPSSTSYTFTIESDGEWAAAYINGQLIGGFLRRTNFTTASVETIAIVGSNGNSATATLTGILTEALQPNLMRGADKGDYVLPGGASTYPSGGLHARYYNDGDLASDSFRIFKILGPSRGAAYGGAGNVPQYTEQQDAQINGQAPPSGAPTDGNGHQINWSCIWFGAIWLRLDLGNYSFTINMPTTGGTNYAVRVWVGQTRFGDQLVDEFSSFVSQGSNFSFTVSASTLAGTIGYGGGTVNRGGWYPIKVEYAVDAATVSSVAPTLKITACPGTYTDPGGGSYTASAVNGNAYPQPVPASSLSPLGCWDNRHQGISHYDLMNQVAVNTGYEYSCEPQSLESGLFPGVCAPRVSSAPFPVGAAVGEGTVYDVIIEPDTGPRREGMVNYSSTLDGTDQSSSIQGNGAGFQNGNTGQLQAWAYDPPTLQASLFDMQGWQDASDAAWLATLQAILNTQLALRLVPWSVVQGDPTAQMREAYTWPLPGTLKNMRWRPGDSVRVWAFDINIQDTTPRKLLVVTRNSIPLGVSGTQVTFAARPKSGVYANRSALRAAIQPQRRYQKQLVSLSGEFVHRAPIRAGKTSNQVSLVSLQPGDLLVKAILRINYNPAGLSVNLVLNGTDVTSSVGGPWTTSPFILNLGAVASPDSNNQLYARLTNNGGSGSVFSWQLLVDVLR